MFNYYVISWLAMLYQESTTSRVIKMILKIRMMPVIFLHIFPDFMIFNMNYKIRSSLPVCLVISWYLSGKSVGFVSFFAYKVMWSHLVHLMMKMCKHFLNWLAFTKT